MAAVRRRPDLAALPPDQRAVKLAARIVADQVVGILAGVWVGMPAVVGGVAAMAAVQALAAGHLRRAGPVDWRAGVQYAELSLAGWLAVLYPVEVAVRAATGLGIGLTAIGVLRVAWVGLPVLGLAVGWRLTTRWAAYTAATAGYLAASQVGDLSLDPTVSGLAVVAVAAAVAAVPVVCRPRAAGLQQPHAPPRRPEDVTP